MKAITVEPGNSGTARLEEVPEPDVRDGSVVVEAVGVRSVRNGRRNRGGKVWMGSSR